MLVSKSNGFQKEALEIPYSSRDMLSTCRKSWNEDLK